MKTIKLNELITINNEDLKKDIQYLLNDENLNLEDAPHLIVCLYDNIATIESYDGGVYIVIGEYDYIKDVTPALYEAIMKQ